VFNDSTILVTCLVTDYVTSEHLTVGRRILEQQFRFLFVEQERKLDTRQFSRIRCEVEVRRAEQPSRRNDMKYKSTTLVVVVEEVDVVIQRSRDFLARQESHESLLQFERCNHVEFRQWHAFSHRETDGV